MGKKGKGPKKKGGASSKSSVSLDVAEYITGRLELLPDSDPPSLALPVGTRVECLRLEGYASKDGRKGPHIGTIAGHWMRCDHWPPNFFAPYLVLLDDGTTPILLIGLSKAMRLTYRRHIADKERLARLARLETEWEKRKNQSIH
jgi:hypothetical protein